MIKAQEVRLLKKVEKLINEYESCLFKKLDSMDKCNELRVNSASSTFNDELKDLKKIAKEHHVVFVQDVKTVRENVNHKIEELKVDVSKELREFDNKYSSPLEKVDIIADVVTTFVKTQ